MLINAAVKTRQKRFSIEKHGNNWKISVKSEPENNKANMEIIKELSKAYKSVKIVKGLKSKNKKILLEQ